MLLQAALNGPWTKAHHPAVPTSTDELVRDAVACVAAGAGAIHLHPRDVEGRERLDPELVDRTVTAVRDACGVPVGVSTGAWIEPDLERRIELIRGWTAPDYASVNLSEEGARDVARALLDARVGIEAAVWTVDEARQLAEWDTHAGITRVLVEPVDLKAAEAVAFVDAIHDVLDRAGVGAPRLQHGDGEATWILIEDAACRGLDTRVGLEDTIHDPDGSHTAGNEALIRAARRIHGVGNTR
jgi:uncharacterized protein (DUF849 family)